LIVADLFTHGELASYTQRSDLDTSTADLLLALVTTEIRGYVGETIYDAMTDAEQQRFKGIALEAVKRALLNPDGVRQFSTTIDDYSESQTYATETFGGVEINETEQARIDRVLGRASGAFTVRAVAQPGYYPRRLGHSYR
jgi:hypothetical protein